MESMESMTVEPLGSLGSTDVNGVSTWSVTWVPCMSVSTTLPLVGIYMNLSFWTGRIAELNLFSKWSHSPLAFVGLIKGLFRAPYRGSQLLPPVPWCKDMGFSTTCTTPRWPTEVPFWTSITSRSTCNTTSDLTAAISCANISVIASSKRRVDFYHFPPVIAY